MESATKLSNPQLNKATVGGKEVNGTALAYQNPQSSRQMSLMAEVLARCICSMSLAMVCYSRLGTAKKTCRIIKVMKRADHCGSSAQIFRMPSTVSMASGLRSWPWRVPTFDVDFFNGHLQQWVVVVGSRWISARLCLAFGSRWRPRKLFGMHTKRAFVS